jgi:hypothetical protein
MYTPFCWNYKMSMVLSMGPNVCEFTRRRWAKLEFVLLDLKDDRCSLYLCKKLLPVCPTYALLQSGHDSLYIPLAEYLSGKCHVERCAPNEFLVLYAIFTFVFLRICVMYLVSLSMYVKVIHFFLCVSICGFWFFVVVVVSFYGEATVVEIVVYCVQFFIELATSSSS